MRNFILGNIVVALPLFGMTAQVTEQGGIDEIRPLIQGCQIATMYYHVYRYMKKNEGNVRMYCSALIQEVQKKGNLQIGYSGNVDIDENILMLCSGYCPGFAQELLSHVSYTANSKAFKLLTILAEDQTVAKKYCAAVEKFIETDSKFKWR